MGRRLAWLVALQWLLGLLALWRREHVLIVTAHVGLGALVLAQAVVLAWQACRMTRATGSGTMQQLADYLALTKPRVAALVLVTAAAGFWLGMPSTHAALPLLPLLVGTAMAVGGANALNQWSERLPDGLMQRTKGRPIPSGRVNPDDALRFGLALSAGGVLVLAVAVNVLAAALTALTIAMYVLAYTPLKRVTSLCTLIGAIPGAMPPVIGWAASRNALSVEAWGLFALLFLWQLPHFLAIAVLYRDDYARAGFRMLPVIEPDGLSTARQTVLYGLALLPVSLFPAFLGFAGAWYGYGALCLGLGFLAVSVRAALVRSVPACQQLFRASVVYLPLLLALMVVDKRGML
jgi:protoheme IX farnesyltransferase